MPTHEANGFDHPNNVAADNHPNELENDIYL